jgi:hypothetical protein
MRKVKERPSGKDQDVLVAEFVISKEEAVILHSLLCKASVLLPGEILNTGTLGRIRNMIFVLGRYLSKSYEKQQ